MLKPSFSNFSKVEKSYFTSLLLSLPIIIVSLSGIVLTLRFHASHGIRLDVWGISRAIWRDIHVYSAIISVLLSIYHLSYLGNRLYKVITSGKASPKPLKASRNLFWVFAMCSISGLMPYIAEVFNINLQYLIEIHDKFGLILVILIVRHIVYKSKSILKVRNNIISKIIRR